MITAECAYSPWQYLGCCRYFVTAFLPIVSSSTQMAKDISVTALFAVPGNTYGLFYGYNCYCIAGNRSWLYLSSPIKKNNNVYEHLVYYNRVKNVVNF
jgi:hypothetical protein